MRHYDSKTIRSAKRIGHAILEDRRLAVWQSLATILAGVCAVRSRPAIPKASGFTLSMTSSPDALPTCVRTSASGYGRKRVPGRCSNLHRVKNRLDVGDRGAVLGDYLPCGGVFQVIWDSFCDAARIGGDVVVFVKHPYRNLAAPL